MIKALIKLAEKGILPDPLIRLGIKRLCEQRLSEASALGPEALEESHQQWIDLSTASPIAIVPEKANEQHYVRTIKYWRQDFTKALPEIRRLGFSDSFIRIWEFYLVYCEAGFHENLIGDFQFVFAKPGSKDTHIRT